MAKVQITSIDSRTYPLRIEYDCTCGAKIVLETDHKPQRLIKCFNCNENVPDLFTLELKKQTQVRRKREKNTDQMEFGQ